MSPIYHTMAVNLLLSNLQPLWAFENIQKGAKFNGVDYRSTPLNLI